MAQSQNIIDKLGQNYADIIQINPSNVVFLNNFRLLKTHKMNRIDRLSAILIQLQSKRIVKAQEIAERFEISLRTVYRDVRSLESTDRAKYDKICVAKHQDGRSVASASQFLLLNSKHTHLIIP